MLSVKRCETSSSLYGCVRSLRQPNDPVRTRRTDELLIRASEIATEDREFIADVRGTVPNRRELMKVYLRCAVRAVLNTGTVVNGRDH
jgi:hypothetical protein